MSIPVNTVLCVLFFGQHYALSFKTGNVYQYSYSTSTVFENADTVNIDSMKKFGVQIVVDFELCPLYISNEQQLFIVQVTSSKYSGFSIKKREISINDLMKYPAYFLLSHNNTIDEIYVANQDPVFSVNIKKGIIALFQFSKITAEKTEIDVNGQCLVSYNVESPTSITKHKRHCRNIDTFEEFSVHNKMFGLSILSTDILEYKLTDGIITNAVGMSTVVLHLNLRSSLNASVVTRQNLLFKDIIMRDPGRYKSVEEVIQNMEMGQDFHLQLSPLTSEVEPVQCTKESECMQEVLQSQVKLSKSKMATVSSAKAFAELLHSMRSASKGAITEILSNPSSRSVVAQVIDAAVAAQTRSSQEALMQWLSSDDEFNNENLERYVFASAYVTHPSEYLINDFLALLNNKNVSEITKESLLLALGSIVYTFCHQQDQYDNPLMKQVQILLTDGINKCVDEKCTAAYLRAFGNAGLPDTLSVIMKFVQLPFNSSLAYTAIDSLRRFDRQLITADVKNVMFGIVHGTSVQYDTSVKIAALEFILKNRPSVLVLRNILLKAVNQEHTEFSTYIHSALLNAADTDIYVQKNLQILFKDLFINNYNTHAQIGKSSTQSNVLARMADMNVTFNMFIENDRSGIMKRSGMDVTLFGRLLEQPFMKFQIYADGLGSLVSDEESKEANDSTQEEVEPTAGMSFSLLGVFLREIEFFKGTAGLMSAVWNAPTELTSALQGNFLLQDHSQRLHLSNGLILKIDLLGSLSMDISGYVSISLWNRNCESLIKNSGALFIDGSVHLDSSLLEAGIRLSGEGQSSIDFISDAEFYEMPLKLCMQMKKPDVIFKQSVVKFEKLKYFKKASQYSVRTYHIPADSYFLSRRNSEECRGMNVRR